MKSLTRWSHCLCMLFSNEGLLTLVDEERLDRVGELLCPHVHMETFFFFFFFKPISRIACFLRQTINQIYFCFNVYTNKRREHKLPVCIFDFFLLVRRRKILLCEITSECVRPFCRFCSYRTGKQENSLSSSSMQRRVNTGNKKELIASQFYSDLLDKVILQVMSGI